MSLTEKPSGHDVSCMSTPRSTTGRDGSLPSTSSPRRLVAAVLGVILAFGATAPTLAQAQPEPGSGTAGDDITALADPDESPALQAALELLPETVRDLPVEGVVIDRLTNEILHLEATILTNRVTRDDAIADLIRLEGERQGHRTRIASQRARRRTAAQEADRLQAELAELAVAAYMGAGDPAPGLNLDPSEASEAGRQRVLVEAVDSTLRERLAEAKAEVASAAAQVEESRQALIETLDTIAATTARRDAAIETLAEAEPALPRAQERFHEEFMVARVAGADFSVVAFDAYRQAEALIATEQPDCRVAWSVLAGIGRVESRHGTYGGARVRADGTTSRRIIGIALDGSPGVMAIPDTDGGALDGDPVYDRAVGPMQFIPSTWRMVRRDANGDGRMDPHNLYDSAAAAAVYLCRAGPRLDQPAPLQRAILSYNRSHSYVEAVLGHRRAYDRLNLR